MLLIIHIFNKKTLMNNKGKDVMFLIDNRIKNDANLFEHSNILT
jgi:hypothetical protein